MIGGRSMTVVSGEEFIKASFSMRTLDNAPPTVDIVSALSGVDLDSKFLGDILKHRIHPIVGRFLRSDEFLQSVSPQLSGSLASFVIRQSSSQDSQPLTEVVGEALISSVSEVIFGSSFPSDTIIDLRLMDKHFYAHLCRFPLTGPHFHDARSRLMPRLKDYLSLVQCQQAPVWPGYPLVKEFLDVAHSIGLSEEDRAALFLTLVWGFTASPINATSWMLVYFLNDARAFAALRSEVDTVLEKYHGSVSEMTSDPQAFGAHSFPIIESSIKESLRLTSNATPFRQATCDLDLAHEKTSVKIKEGDFIMSNIRAPHFNPSVYRDPHTFVFDRFLGCGAGDQHFFAFGGGKHACKGRMFAFSHIKTFVALLVYLADVKVLNNQGVPIIPCANERSVNIVQMGRDVVVQLMPRH